MFEAPHGAEGAVVVGLVHLLFEVAVAFDEVPDGVLAEYATFEILWQASGLVVVAVGEPFGASEVGVERRDVIVDIRILFQGCFQG